MYPRRTCLSADRSSMSIDCTWAFWTRLTESTRYIHLGGKICCLTFFALRSLDPAKGRLWDETMANKETQTYPFVKGTHPKYMLDTLLEGKPWINIYVE